MQIMVGVRLRLLSILTIQQFTLVRSLLCPPGSLPYPPTSCASFGEEPNGFGAAQARCALDGGALLSVGNSVQLTVALRYVESLGQVESAYWINVSGALASQGGQCAAIRNATLLTTVNCSQPLSRLCQINYTATPTVSMRATPTSPVAGAAVTLTCSYSNSTSVSLQKDDVPVNTSTVPLNASSSQLSLTLASIQAGRYDCVASNPLGAVKSNAIVIPAGGATTIAPITLTLNGATTNSPVILALGTIFNITCSTSSSVSWTWFRNGLPLSPFSPSSPSSITVADFTIYNTSGFYQCRALDPSSNSNVIAQILVLATGGIPAIVDDVLVKAWSRSELQVLWYPPYRPNTDLALLRYQFLYGVGSPDITSFSNGSFLKPSNSLPLNGTIQGLLPGTTYEVAVLVCSEIGCDFFHMLPTMAMTFGLAANSAVQGVMLSYDGAGGVFVAWAPLIPHPPEGAVAFYEVQYGSISYDEAVTVYPPSNSVHLIGVTDIYKARVRAAVKVRMEPETYDYNQWSQWVEQPTGAWSATNPSAVPTVQPMPTTGGEAVSPLVGVVIPSVVVPVVVVIGVLGMGVALLIWCYRQRKNSTDLNNVIDGPTNDDVIDDPTNDKAVLTTTGTTKL